MEAIGLVARLDGVTAGELIERVHDAVLEPCFPRTAAEGGLSLARRCFVTWCILYFGAIALYLTFASLDTVVLALLRKAKRRQRKPIASNAGREAVVDSERNRAFTDAIDGDYWLVPPEANVRGELWMSISSLALMTALSVPLEVGVQLGYSKVYHYAAEHSLGYLLLSPLLFIVVSDCSIYFIHRGLHHRSIYRFFHKAHHGYIHTTAFAAFAFHPVDGFLQGVSYQLFVYVFPFHSIIHLISMSVVLLWTINIHDRSSLGIPGVNGAAHHTIHHTTFKSNYGQYLTLWDRVFGTHRDPCAWQRSGAKVLSEKEVYGKFA
jgi:Delta7-sterol 5-desaturase